MNKKMMGDRLYLRRPELDDAAAFLTLRSNNRSFLRPMSPTIRREPTPWRGNRRPFEESFTSGSRGRGLPPGFSFITAIS